MLHFHVARISFSWKIKFLFFFGNMSFLFFEKPCCCIDWLKVLTWLINWIVYTYFVVIFINSISSVWDHTNCFDRAHLWLYGCVSQGLGNTEFTTLIGWNRHWKQFRFSHLDRHTLWWKRCKEKCENIDYFLRTIFVYGSAKN